MPDPYDGHVTAGGPPAVRELPALTIRKLEVGTFGNNAYLLTSRHTGAQLLIDAAADAARLVALVQECSHSGEDLLELVVTTHSHPDHTGALEDVVGTLGARTAAGDADADALPVHVDVRLHQGDTVHVGDLALDVVHLRGHTPGSVALAYRDGSDPDGRTHLFTGDTLFPGGIGNTKNPGQSFDALYADVTERIFDVYDDDTWIYPGHGDDTTLGAERPHLDEWRRRGW